MPMRQSKPDLALFASAWHLPVVLMLGIYLPAAVFGAYVFRDRYAISFLVMLGLFVLCYYALYPRFAAMLRQPGVRDFFWRIGARVDWRWLAWAACAVYVVTLLIASVTTDVTPLGAALRGYDLQAIANARAEFLAKRQGQEALLRYVALILGRSVLPFVVTYLYWTHHKTRHLALLGLLLSYLLSLEKASAIFAFLPLIILSLVRRELAAACAKATILVLCIALWTYVSMGGLHKPMIPAKEVSTSAEAVLSQPAAGTPDGFLIGRRGDPNRHYVFNMLNLLGIPLYFGTDGKDFVGRLMIISNRAIWIPYVTAYDWLKFQDEVFAGRLTMGRSIGVVAWLLGEPRLQLEQMVYEYEFGPPPGGAGASNTVFLVDAKLAFGWPGVLMYCVLFTFFSAVILSSANVVVKVASATSFFTAALSPLTATLLSGGMFFYLVIALLLPASLDEQTVALPPKAD